MYVGENGSIFHNLNYENGFIASSYSLGDAINPPPLPRVPPIFSQMDPSERQWSGGWRGGAPTFSHYGVGDGCLSYRDVAPATGQAGGRAGGRTPPGSRRRVPSTLLLLIPSTYRKIPKF